MYFLLPVLLLAMLLGLFFLHVRKKRILLQLSTSDIGEKNRLLNELVKPYGLSYNLAKDIFSYTSDNVSLSLPLTIDYEPISFIYDGYKWLIELWKGQSNISLSAGLRISCSDSPILESDIPLCSYTLYKGIVPVYQIHMNRSRQITGFCIGRYSEAELLRMDLTMTFKNSDMLDAFVDGLKKSGYRASQFDFCRSVVSFTFYVPASVQPRNTHRFFSHVKQWQNRFILFIYQIATHPFGNTIDRLLLLYKTFPFAFKHIFTSTLR